MEYNNISYNEKNKIEKYDEAFGIILRGIETRMSENILTTMFNAMRTDYASYDRYYAVK